MVVAIYDATNSTRDRRAMIHAHCTQHGIAPLFIESICTDPELILANIREVKLSSPDYAGCADEQQAVRDFQQRIAHYAQTYEPMDSTPAPGPERTYAYVQLTSTRARVVINRVRGPLQSRIAHFLINLRITPRSIFLVRHGESLHNQQGRIGGDAALSPAGEAFARALPALLQRCLPPDARASLHVWTSTLRRTLQTAAHLPGARPRALKALDELDAGVCDGLTYAQIAARFPADLAARDADKFAYRYRGGESYADLVHRIEPVIMELERCGHVLIIAHQAVLRVILAYFLHRPHAQLPYLNVPLHTLIRLTPKAYDCAIDLTPVPDIPAVDTYRPQPCSQ